MRLLYSTLMTVFKAILPASTLFSDKMNLFVAGRKDVFDTLQKNISGIDKTIWFHCASLGEYEQGLPVMEAIKQRYQDHKLVVTFFSPSGYENKKANSIADVLVYLPLDTKRNVKRFLDLVHPELAIFVKYEFWPNYLLELRKRTTPTYLISALFRKKQVFFKPYGFWMRKVLKSFTHIFVQDEKSKLLLESISVNQVLVSGDTRYDRVSKQIEEDNTLDFLSRFKGDSLCVVAGSTWPEDEYIMVDYINQLPDNLKFIVAPHNINKEQISAFQNRLSITSVQYSQMKGKDVSNFKVFILDTIGHLKKAYSYADIAYVGGGMGTTGLHNILEAATFGIPLIIGKNYEKFPEAKALQSRAGLFSVATKEEFEEVLNKLVTNKSFREKTGMINGHFVQNNTGATNCILQNISLLGD